MLVLTRKIHEKITLPTVGATIEVVPVEGGTRPPRHRRPAGRHRPAAQWPSRRRNGARPRRAPTPRRTRGPRRKCTKLQVAERLKTTAMGLGAAPLPAGRGAPRRGVRHPDTAAGRPADPPLRRGGEDKPATPAAPPRQPTRPRRALLVEDDRNQRELLAGFLRQSGLDGGHRRRRRRRPGLPALAPPARRGPARHGAAAGGRANRRCGRSAATPPTAG